VGSSIMVVLILLLAAAVVAQPADSLDTAPGDSLGTDGEGTLGGDLPEGAGSDDREEEYEDDEEGEGPRRRGRGRRAAGDSLFSNTWASWLLNTRPDIQLKIDRRKDVTNWDTKINVNRRVSSKLRFNLGATLHTQENTTLNRSDSNDGTSASLKYQLSEDIGFSLRYNSMVAGYRYNLKSADPAERRRKQNVSVSTDFNKQLTSALSFRLGTSAGTTQNSYASVSNEGSQQDIATSLSYSPAEDLNASVSYNARRLLLDSRVDSSGTSVFTSKDRTFSQDLSLSVKYDMLPGIKISMDASQTDNEKQNPDPTRKDQETENKTSRRAGVNTSFDLVTWATWGLSVDFHESQAKFRLQSNRNNAISSSSLKGSAKVLPWRGATVNLGGTREITRNQYETLDTGHDTHKSLSLKLSQGLGRKTNMDLTALVDLVSVFYDNTDENPKDRDRLNRRISSSLSHEPWDNVKTRLAGEFSEDKTVYVREERSANNRTNRKYRLSGDYDLKTYYNITVSQKYDISAVYSFYEYNESNNTLVRNSNVTTQFRVPLTSKVNVNINHSFQFQDQGNYSEEGGTRLYARSSEKETHSMSLICRYTPLKGLNVMAKQTYRTQRNWDYDEGQKYLDYEVATSDISGRINFSYTIGERTKISLKFDQNLREGSNVNEAFKNYRNIELEASHAF
jgi:hypothetical protein